MSEVESADIGSWTFNPTDWDDLDIRQAHAIEQSGLPLATIALPRRKYNEAKNLLRKGLIGVVAYDNPTEASRYEYGSVFDPPKDQLAHGSVVIIAEEEVEAWIDGDEVLGFWERPYVASKDVYPDIHRPYLGYWLDNQGLGNDELHTGRLGTKVSIDGMVSHTRTLSFGTLMDINDSTRVVQPFGFDTTYTISDLPILSAIQVEKYKKPPRSNRDAIVLPIETEKPTEKKIEVMGRAIQILKRTSSVDIIHVAEDEDEGKGKGPRLPVHKLFPKLNIGHIR